MRTATTSRAKLTKKIAVNNVTSQEASEVLEKTLEYYLFYQNNSSPLLRYKEI